MDFTFENLPKRVQELHIKLDSLLEYISHLDKNVSESEEWFDLDELLDFLPQKYKKATIYEFTSLNRIPFYKKGKQNYFLKSEILEWLKEGKVETNNELSNKPLLK